MLGVGGNQKENISLPWSFTERLQKGSRVTHYCSNSGGVKKDGVTERWRHGHFSPQRRKDHKMQL